MIARVLRLVRAEFVKLFAHPFIYVAVAVLLVTVLMAAHYEPLLHGQKETEWRAFHAIQLFTYGVERGLYVASFLLVIFSSLMFAGEFDRGTIKILLTRPITRTDLFVAKTLTVFLLTLFFYGLVLYVSFLYGTARGELGPVWDDQTHLLLKGYDDLLGHAKKAVLMGFLPLLAASMMGMLMSNLTETSAYAVAIGLIVFMVMELAYHFKHDTDAAYWFFNYYTTYSFNVLQQYSEGYSIRWDTKVDAQWLAYKVPLFYIGGFLAGAYGLFRFKNITA